MARQKVLSVAELLAREAMQQRGENPDSPVVVQDLRNRVAELEGKLAAAETRLSTNRASPSEVRRTLDSLLEHYAVEPAEELIKAAMERGSDGRFTLSPMDRVEIWQGLMRYRMPQLKAVEHSGKIDTQLNITVKNYHTNVVMDQRTVVIKKEDGYGD